MVSKLSRMSEFWTYSQFQTRNGTGIFKAMTDIYQDNFDEYGGATLLDLYMEYLYGESTLPYRLQPAWAVRVAHSVFGVNKPRYELLSRAIESMEIADLSEPGGYKHTEEEGGKDQTKTDGTDNVTTSSDDTTKLTGKTTGTSEANNATTGQGGRTTYDVVTDFNDVNKETSTSATDGTTSGTVDNTTTKTGSGSNNKTSDYTNVTTYGKTRTITHIETGSRDVVETARDFLDKPINTVQLSILADVAKAIFCPLYLLEDEYES